MQKLVFETPDPQVDLLIDMSGMDANQAAEYMRNWRERWSPRNINLGCGPEPANVDADALRQSVAELMAVKPNSSVDMGVIGRAEAAKAFFYWRYATELAKKHLRQTRSEEEANRLIGGDDRTELCTLRNEKMRYVMKARFDIDMDVQSVDVPATGAPASTADGTATAAASRATGDKPPTRRRRRK